jgi:hypothetical protein
MVALDIKESTSIRTEQKPGIKPITFLGVTMVAETTNLILQVISLELT